MADQDDLLREKLDQMNQPDKIDQFLNVISQIESSGGIDTDHPEVESGIHAGSSAMGQYGLMPNTVKEMAVRARRAGNITPEMQSVADVDPEQMRAMLEQDPGVEQEYARRLAEKVLNQFPNDEEAAYSWNQGHNLTPKKVQSRGYEQHPYVQKFRNLKNKIAGK